MASIKVSGGPPPPVLHCSNCGKKLTGRPEHRKDASGNLFCDESCKEEFSTEMHELNKTPA